MNPKNTETTTDMYMPTAAERDAWCVSSATCADASKPVIVYWAISRPVRNTYQNTMLPKVAGADSPPQPVALIVSVKTKLNERCSSGTVARMITMTTTPIMCQYAEIVFSIAVIVTLNRFNTSAASSTIAYVR